MKTCPTCQHTYSDDVGFCIHDGARLAAEFREERECPYCAERILKKARVCKHCGHDVEPLAGTGIAAQAPPPAPAGAGPPQLQTIPEPPGKMKLVAIAGAALILIVAGVWYFSQHGPKKGEVKVNPKDGLKYVWIPPGTFMMGCSPGDTICIYIEEPTHQVTITKGFWIGQTEVTVGAYKRFVEAMGRRMSPAPNFNGGWVNDSMPIVNVTWNDAHDYCTWAGGRLPSEAEWEYAARGGGVESRYGPLDEVAWYSGNSGHQAHPVGQKRANGFGLYDVLGNVWEWVNDWFDAKYYQSSPSQDPAGPTSGRIRVLRGGSWVFSPQVVRVSARYGADAGDRDANMGFRCRGEVSAP